MRLEEYLYRKDETQGHFAERSGVSQSTISRVCNGGDTSGMLWARITAATGGKVRPEHHFPWKTAR